MILAKKDFEIFNSRERTSTFLGSSLLAMEISESNAYSLFFVSNINFLIFKFFYFTEIMFKVCGIENCSLKVLKKSEGET
jgi:hypothetical protein